MADGSDCDAGQSDSDKQLSEYEEMFKHRYTDEDETFMKVFSAPFPDPPCVENWTTKPKRNFDYTRGRGRGGGGGRGHHHRGGYHDRNNDHHHGYNNRHHDRNQGHHRPQPYGQQQQDRGYRPY